MNDLPWTETVVSELELMMRRERRRINMVAVLLLKPKTQLMLNCLSRSKNARPATTDGGWKGRKGERDVNILLSYVERCRTKTKGSQ